MKILKYLLILLFIFFTGCSSKQVEINRIDNQIKMLEKRCRNAKYSNNSPKYTTCKKQKNVYLKAKLYYEELNSNDDKASGISFITIVLIGALLI